MSLVCKEPLTAENAEDAEPYNRFAACSAFSAVKSFVAVALCRYLLVDARPL
jgi:hypothetical protein